MKDKKKVISMSLAAFLLLMILVGSTYAYFKAQTGDAENVPTQVTTNTTDLLTFKVEKDINVTADMSNFAQGMGNRNDSTTAKAILRANNATNHAEAKYNIYFVIDSNELTYTTEEHIPELLLKVIDPKGKEAINITGLVYTDEGFDITGRTGGFLIASDYEIVADNTTTEQEWSVTVELVNLNNDQTANGGKNLTGHIFITKEEMPSYELLELNTMNVETTYDSIAFTLEYTKGSEDIDKYYFASEEVVEDSIASSVAKKTARVALDESNLVYHESDTPNYKFSNLKDNTTYKIYSYGVDINGFKSNVYSTEVRTDAYTLARVTKVATSSTVNSITVNATGIGGTGSVSQYCYSRDNLDYVCNSNTSTTDSYTFSGLSEDTNHTIKVKIIDSNERDSTEYDTSEKTKIYLSNQVKRLYTGAQGKNNIYYHTSSLANSAKDNSYRYAGSYEDVENYVCFGYDDASKKYESNWCPNDNLYRIIGVFGNQVKLIKVDFATTSQLGTTGQNGTIKKSSYPNYKGALIEIPAYYWSGSSSNKVNSWASSTLNTNALNGVFLGNFSTTWRNKIATTNWKVGGNTNLTQQKASITYQNEIVNSVTGQTAVNNKIGLMYVSDYMYGASSNYWTKVGNDKATTDYRAAVGSNWMYSGIIEWTISRASGSTTIAFFVSNTGCLGSSFVYDRNYGVRPVFYLESTVTKIGGTGSSSDPYRVN